MRFVILMLLLSSSALAQLDVTTKIVASIDFTAPPRVVGNSVLYAQGTKKSEGLTAYLTCTGPYKVFDVSAERMEIIDGKIVTTQAVVEQAGSDREFSIKGKGTFTVDVRGYGDTIKRWPKYNIDLDEPEPNPPGPDPKPTPDVPTDSFDNIGQRIAGWAQGLPKTKEVSLIYLKYAKELKENPKAEIVASFSAAQKERVTLLGTEASKYNTVITKINDDIAARGPMAKGVVALYFEAMAAGFAGAK